MCHVIFCVAGSTSAGKIRNRSAATLCCSILDDASSISRWARASAFGTEYRKLGADGVSTLDVETGDRLRSGSKASDERISRVRQELHDFVSQRPRSKEHTIRDQEAIDQLRSLGYVD